MKLTPELDEHITHERKFLHDISNHLVIAQGMGSFISKIVKELEELDDKDKARAEKMMVALERMVKSVQARREVLYEKLGLNKK